MKVSVEQRRLATMLSVATKKTGYTMEEKQFDLHVFRNALAAKQKKLIYAHLSDEQSVLVRTFIDEVADQAGYGGLNSSARLNVVDHTIIVGSNLLLTVKAKEISIDYLIGVLDPDRNDNRCCVCRAPPKYSNITQARQCLKCPARICRACVADNIDVSVKRFIEKQKQPLSFLGMNDQGMTDLFCPRCPKCNTQRLCDLPTVRDKMMESCRSGKTKCKREGCVAAFDQRHGMAR